MAETLQDYIDTAVEDLRAWAEDNPDCDEPHDVIHEFADSGTPCMNATLLQLAADNYDLALAEPEVGPAFDGKPTPVNIIAANVYEAIEAGLWEEWERIKQEREEED